MPTLLESFQERIRETTRRLRERFQDNSIYDAANYTVVEESPSPTYHLWYDHTLTNKTYEDTTPYPDLIMVLLGPYQSEEERKIDELYRQAEINLYAFGEQRMFVTPDSAAPQGRYYYTFVRNFR